jgi:hypothetical protein
MREKLLWWSYIAYTALTFYWMFHYTGPARWVGEIQISLFGAYWNLLSLILMNIPGLLLLGYFQSKTASPSNSLERPPSKFPEIYAFIVPAIVLGITILIAIDTNNQASAPDLGNVSMSNIEAGKINNSSYYAKTSGYLNKNYVSIEKDNSVNGPFFPVHATPNSSTPVALVANFTSTKLDDELIAFSEDKFNEYIEKNSVGGQVTLQGFVDSALPGEARAWLKKKGIKVAENAKTLKVGAQQTKGKEDVYWVLGIGLGITLGLALLIFFQEWQATHKI